MFPSVRQGPVVARAVHRARLRPRGRAGALRRVPRRADERADLKLALNRLSSALYLMTVKYVAGRYGGEHARRAR